MRKNRHKMLSWLLCTAMLCSSCTPVFAEDVLPEQTVEVHDHAEHDQEEAAGDAQIQKIAEALVSETTDTQSGETDTDNLKTGESEDTGASASPEGKTEPETEPVPQTTPGETETEGTKETPGATETQGAAGDPSATDAPETAPTQEATPTPEVTPNPEATSTPEAAPTPETTPAPDAQPTEEPGAQPGATAQPTEIPQPSTQPEAGSPQESAPGMEDPSAEPTANPDMTRPEITLEDPSGTYREKNYYCSGTTVTVTDAGGNLKSVTAEWTKDNNTGTIDNITISEGKTCTIELEAGIGEVTITAVDEAENTEIKTIVVNHLHWTLRRADYPANCTEPERTTTNYLCCFCDTVLYGYTVYRKEGQPALGHAYDETNAKEYNVCGEGGTVKLSPCKRCGALVNEEGKVSEIPEDGAHSWVKKKKEPTCDVAGYDYEECSVCGIIRNVVYLDENGKQKYPSTGHHFSNWVTVEPGLCNGEKPCVQEQTCIVCKKKRTQSFTSTVHSYSETREVLVEPTCTTAGKSGFRCTRCGAANNQYIETIPALGHQFAEGRDCTQEAECTRCREKVPAGTAHNLKNKADGDGHWQVCTNEGCTYQTETEAHVHRADNFLCTNRWNCTVCGYSVKGQSAHDTELVSDGEYHWLVCKNEDCTYQGKKTAHWYKDEKDCTKDLKCSTCGYVVREAMESHNMVWRYNTAMHWHVCTNPGCSVRTYSGDEDYGEHKYGAFTDCTKGRVCECGYQFYAPAVSHNFHNAPIVGKEDGHYQKCLNYVCREEKKVGEHTGGTATCVAQAICDTCHLAYGEVNASNHVGFAIQGEKAATTEQEGYTGDQVCTACSAVIKKGEVIPKLEKKCTHVGTIEKAYDDNYCWDHCTNCHLAWNRVAHTLAYASDQTGHWQYCVSCQHKNALVPHTPNPNEIDTDCSTKLTCADCQYEIEPAKTHVYDESFVSGPNGHWQVCKNDGCSHTSAETAHTPVKDDGDCTTDVVCADCGYAMSEKVSEHQWSPVWEADENGHYKKCLNIGCTKELREEHVKCEDDGNCTTPIVCSTCSYVMEQGEAAHKFGGAYVTDEDGHYQKCQNEGCTVDSGESAHAGGTANCIRPAVCAVCGQEYGEKDPLHHEGGAEIRNYKEPTTEEEGYTGDTYCLGCDAVLTQGNMLEKLDEEHEHENRMENDATHHWLECPCGVRTDIAPHTPDEYHKDNTHHWQICTVCHMVVNRGDHEYEDGKCKICGFKQPEIQHDYKWEFDDNGHRQRCRICGGAVNEATHTFTWVYDDESHSRQCVCGKITDSGEHSLKWVSDGEKHWRECACGYKCEEAPHTADADDGDCMTAVHCTACGAVMREAKEAHTWGDLSVADERGCWYECINEGCTQKSPLKTHEPIGDESDCTKDIRCKNCGYVIREGKTAHNFAGAYSEDGRTHWLHCQNEGCAATSTPEVHRGGKATCDKPAVCEVCGASYGSTDASAHVWGEWQTLVEATVTHAGIEQRTCEVCGLGITRDLAEITPTIHVNVTTVPMKVKQSTTKVTVSGLAKGDEVVSWTTSNKKVATVSTKGKITAHKAGKATITITLASGLTKKITVNVKKTTVKTTSISVPSKKLTLKKGKKYTLKPTVKPITSQQKVTYETSNSKIATVSSKGVIKAKKAGKVNITIKSGSKKVVVKLTVKK